MDGWGWPIMPPTTWKHRKCQVQKETQHTVLKRTKCRPLQMKSISALAIWSLINALFVFLPVKVFLLGNNLKVISTGRLWVCVCVCVWEEGGRERVGDMERKARWRKPRQNTSTLSSLHTPPLSFHQGVPKRQRCWIRKDVCVSLCVNVCLRMCVELVSEFRCLSTPGLHRDETSPTISLSPPWLFQTTHAMHRKMQTWEHTPFQPPTLI